MCLGIPGKLETISCLEPFEQSGRVNFNGIVKEVSLMLVDGVEPGDFVIVHAGFAISKVDEVEAKRIFAYLEQIGELEELAGEAE